MSYDIMIQSDERFSQSADLMSVYSFIAAMSHMTAVDDRQFDYNNGKRQCSFSLDYVDEEGTTYLYDFETQTSLDETDERVRGKVNLISTSIPYGFEPAELLHLWDVCFPIAAHLGWRVFDPQLGDYVEAY